MSQPNSAGVFLYFLPGLEAAKTNRKSLLATPIASAVSDVLRSERLFREFVSLNDVAIGPNGSSGVLVAVVPTNWPNPHKIGYYADEQTWRDCGAYWLGHNTHCAPGPQTLERGATVSGYEVELGDGCIWFAPTIRRWEEASIRNNLPMTIAWNKEGECVGETVPDLKWAWVVACELWEFRCGIKSFTVGEFNERAVRCLSVNYRVGIYEASALGLLTTTNAEAIVDAAVDQHIVNEFIEAQKSKKNQSVPEA